MYKGKNENFEEGLDCFFKCYPKNEASLLIGMLLDWGIMVKKVLCYILALEIYGFLFELF